MIDIDRWNEIYLMLSHHKLRTTLTAFGVFWGIFMLVALLGVGKGLSNGALATFGGHTNTVFIWVQGKTQIPYKGLNSGRRIALNDRDLEAIRNLNSIDLWTDVNDAGGWQTQQYVVFQNKSGSFGARGAAPDAFEIAGYELLFGRPINEFDYQQKRKVVVLGTKALEILFENNHDIIGQYISIAGVSFKVIGAFKSSSLGNNAKEDSERLLIPNSTLRYTFNQSSVVGHFQITPALGLDAQTLERQVTSIIKSNHRVHPSDDVLGTWNSEKQYKKVQGLFKGIQTFSWIVAVGTVIAGVVGVGNIMLIVVKERTREIGVRKAIGATSFNIVSTIVQESLLITLLSGYLGLFAGVLALEGIDYAFISLGRDFAFRNPEIDLSAAVLALGVLVVAGLLASVLPAYKAAAVNPIVALQDE